MSLGRIVARNIRRLRLERGLTQEALAVDAGIDRTYVSRLERGLENPTIAVLEKLARALSSNIEELFRAPCAGEAPNKLPAGARPDPSRTRGAHPHQPQLRRHDRAAGKLADGGD